MTLRNITMYKGRIVFCLILAAILVAFFLNREEPFAFEPRDGVYAPLMLREGSYAAYLQLHSAVPWGTDTIEIDIFSPAGGDGWSILADFEGEAQVLRTEEASYIEFAVHVPATGLYNLVIEYFPLPARGIDIVRELHINGEVPFFGAELITLSRTWGDSPVGVRVDSRGNQIRPPQIEHPRWSTVYFRDRLGFFTEPYRFFFEAGENIIRLTGVNEPVVIRRLALVPITLPPTNAEFLASDHQFGIGDPNFHLRVQGQHSTMRSSPSLFPLFDSSSGITDPPSASLITLNMIGGEPWRIPGQWIEWEFYVPVEGLYRISISARQSYNRGFVSNRTLYLNHVIPFAEVAAIPFYFNNSWQLTTLQDSLGEYLLFPMHAGINTIRLEVTLGDMGEIVDRMLQSVYRLNAIYREILVLTGPSPDPLRDYRVHYWLPHVMDMIYLEAQALSGVVWDMTYVVGDRNEHAGLAAAVVRQLELFYNRPDRIPLQMAHFQRNISALGDAARILTEGQLDIDFIIVSGVDAELPIVRETFVGRVAHELRAFTASFTMDFDTLGDIHDGDRTIDVWIPTGRDQATILKTMIDDSFVPDSGIGVNLRLVDMTAVLPAVVAGIGPDIALSLPLPDPVNYALRNAVVDLRRFPDFDDVAARFAESAMVPFEFNGGYFALPETQNFSVMFYRADIFADLGLEIPQTWDQVMGIMPTLQRNNMSVGMPSVADPMNPDIAGLLTQIYQRGGFLFNEDNSRTILDSEEAIAGFEAYTRFFTHLGTPQFYNFINRFRSGEMPIGFQDFGWFNFLSVFAPEIQGQWNFALMPGIMQEDGTINHTVPAWGTAAVLFAQSERQDEGWEFLKWWTSAETQLRFGREMESIMGSAARFPTANLEAFQSLPWSSAELAVLTEQRSWTLGTPEVPGGYYVGRHLINASRRVINNNVDTRETLLDFAIVINRELINKRREFGLE